MYALGTSLRWSIAPDASRRLANLALDLPEDDSIAVGAVRAAPLLDLERHVTDELCAALASLCGDNAGNESRLCATPETHTRLQLPRGGVQLRVASNGGAELLSIVVTPALLHGKARAPGLPRSTPIKPLALRSDSLAPIEVRLSAVLGQAELSVQQLLGLEAGDVIAIDRTLDSPVDVIVEQRDGCGPRNLGTGHVGRTGRNLSIQLNAIHGRNAL
ncbi:FliM/FliN family flagellar motor C-terminal domain-containing protein [Paraburkholderia sp. IW21]|uniref:FliM/FliN family flagellar motor C-terminal domain-containing protein n=1 Tax=Paraburkholderia sp. IW21 TaxID=3242488 RepID=UPI00352181FC